MTSNDTTPTRDRPVNFLFGRYWVLSVATVFGLALIATVPTAGDLGLTWDEPAYRYSELVSQQWWERLASSRSWADVSRLLEPESLVYYWPYGRQGNNLHPPLAGQLSLLTHAFAGQWMKDTASRRLASVLEYSLCITILFGFLSRRYGFWTGIVAAGALLVMPRVYGDGHVAGTDMPGLLLWAATAVTFWKAITTAHGTRWRILTGILVGLGFVEKMAAMAVIAPLAAWLLIARLPRTVTSVHRRQEWIDGIVTSLALLCPLVIASAEIIRIARILPPPGRNDLYQPQPESGVPGIILAVPLALWGARRWLGYRFRQSPTWGVERPALDTWYAIVTFAPLVAWIGNPLWWRETIPRLANYLMINIGRRGVLPDIPILYFGQTYQYTLPWHNAWVLIAITVPVTLLATAFVGIIYSFWVARRDLLPLYLLLHLLTLPVIRMFGTPAHDGVRLFLPTFFFLAALTGFGTILVAKWLANLTRISINQWACWLAILVLGPAGWQLVRIHPFELSYYNELIGGVRGARSAGMEITYWYDAFNTASIDEIEQRLPTGATVDFLNPMGTTETFAELQSLGELRADLVLGVRDNHSFPYVWLLTQDSKATAFTRLLYQMRPWYESRPLALQHHRVLSVADPIAVSRAWALELLLDAAAGGPPEEPAAPAWIRGHVPPLAWFWGDGVPRYKTLNVHKPAFDWARNDPEGIRSAAKAIVGRRLPLDDNALRLLAILKRHDPLDPPGRLASDRLMRARPEALLEAVEILITRSADLQRLLTQYEYADIDRSGKFLDQMFW